MNTIRSLITITRRSISRLSLVLIAVIALPALPAQAQKDVPLKGNVLYQATTTVVVPGVRWLVEGNCFGTATHVGKFTATFFYDINLLTGEVTGEVIGTAANGDQFGGPVTGHVIPGVEGGIEGDVLINYGTGRFTNATGLAHFITDANTARYDGRISYSASDRKKN
jgi:hypothetical protein